MIQHKPSWWVSRKLMTSQHAACTENMNHLCMHCLKAIHVILPAANNEYAPPLAQFSMLAHAGVLRCKGVMRRTTVILSCTNTSRATSCSALLIKVAQQVFCIIINLWCSTRLQLSISIWFQKRNKQATTFLTWAPHSGISFLDSSAHGNGCSC